MVHIQIWSYVGNIILFIIQTFMHNGMYKNERKKERKKEKKKSKKTHYLSSAKP